jgi:hypothetical protein
VATVTAAAGRRAEREGRDVYVIGAIVRVDAPAPDRSDLAFGLSVSMALLKRAA